MQDKRSGFTLVEVLVAVIIFAFGILSMAAFASLNYMYLRTNQAKARLSVLNESMVDDLQNWIREPVPMNGPTRFDSMFGSHLLGTGPVPGETLRTFVSPGSTTVAVVIFDTILGLAPSDSDAKIFVYINSWVTIGDRVVEDSVNFALANYGMGE